VGTPTTENSRCWCPHQHPYALNLIAFASLAEGEKGHPTPNFRLNLIALGEGIGIRLEKELFLEALLIHKKGQRHYTVTQPINVSNHFTIEVSF